MDTLLDWITSGTNYARWKGDADGVTKQTLCGEIVGRLKEAGIHHRNAADVRTKLSSFQTSYNKARDWSENTGEGIRAEGGDSAEETNPGYDSSLNLQRPFLPLLNTNFFSPR